MAHDLPAAYKCSLVFIVECIVVEVGVSLFTGLDWTGLDWSHEDNYCTCTITLHVVLNLPSPTTVGAPTVRLL